MAAAAAPHSPLLCCHYNRLKFQHCHLAGAQYLGGDTENTLGGEVQSPNTRIPHSELYISRAFPFALSII